MTIRRVLVAVDGSPTSTSATEWAAELSAAIGAEVIAVHALGLLDHDAQGHLIATQTHRAEITRRFESTWCEPLSRSGVTYRCVVHDGDSVSVILGIAAAESADLIVLGSRGLGGTPAQLLGSTSTQVAQRSPVPITIVPAAA